MKDEGFGTGSVLMAFLLGGVVGAGLALLLAPQSGEETRRKIREFTDDVKDKATGFVDQATGKVNEYVDEGKGFYEEKKTLLKAAVDAGKDAYEKEKEKLSKA
ncbi:MAG: YtxH domain-containing protein [Thermodesulfovibrionales bacterium]